MASLSGHGECCNEQRQTNIVVEEHARVASRDKKKGCVRKVAETSHSWMVWSNQGYHASPSSSCTTDNLFQKRLSCCNRKADQSISPTASNYRLWLEKYSSSSLLLSLPWIATWPQRANYMFVNDTYMLTSMGAPANMFPSSPVTPTNSRFLYIEKIHNIQKGNASSASCMISWEWLINRKKPASKEWQTDFWGLHSNTF